MGQMFMNVKNYRLVNLTTIKRQSIHWSLTILLSKSRSHHSCAHLTRAHTGACVRATSFSRQWRARLPRAST